MLVLTRKPEEVLLIGDQIRIKVISTHGNRVRLGIEAPPNISIQREEMSWQPAGMEKIFPKLFGEAANFNWSSDFH